MFALDVPGIFVGRQGMIIGLANVTRYGEGCDCCTQKSSGFGSFRTTRTSSSRTADQSSTEGFRALSKIRREAAKLAA
jgi:hypothetical protein